MPRTGATIKSKPLIPNAVANRINKPVVKPPPQKPPPQKQKAQEKPNASSDESDGEESTAQTVMDFFSLNEPPPPIEDYAPVEDIPIHKKIVDEPNPYEHLTDEQLAEYQDEPQDPCPSSSQNETVEINNEVVSDYFLLSYLRQINLIFIFS